MLKDEGQGAGATLANFVVAASWADGAAQSHEAKRSILKFIATALGSVHDPAGTAALRSPIRCPTAISRQSCATVRGSARLHGMQTPSLRVSGAWMRRRVEADELAHCRWAGKAGDGIFAGSRRAR